MSAVAIESRPAVSSPRVRARLHVALSDEAVDVVFLVCSVLLGLVGFHTVYGGYGFMSGAAIGLAFGIAIAHLANRFRLPSLVAIGAGVAGYFAFGGGATLRSTALGGVIPTPNTLQTLGSATVHSWRDLLTLLPPVGNSGPLLVIPYLLGMAAGVGGILLARRTLLALPSASRAAGCLGRKHPLWHARAGLAHVAGSRTCGGPARMGGHPKRAPETCQRRRHPASMAAGSWSVVARSDRLRRDDPRPSPTARASSSASRAEELRATPD